MRDDSGPTSLARVESADSMGSLLREAASVLEPSSVPAWRVLSSGDVLSGRFVIERVAASGGMRTIHRGKDLESGEAVAIKVMAPGRSGDIFRFEGARSDIDTARALVVDAAACIADPILSRSFLTVVDVNRHALALAEARLDPTRAAPPVG